MKNLCMPSFVWPSTDLPRLEDWVDGTLAEDDVYMMPTTEAWHVLRPVGVVDVEPGTPFFTRRQFSNASFSPEAPMSEEVMLRWLKQCGGALHDLVRVVSIKFSFVEDGYSPSSWVITGPLDEFDICTWDVTLDGERLGHLRRALWAPI